MKKHKKKYYTIYDNRTDTIVAFGDANECAKARNVTLDSFRSFVSNTRSGRTKNYSVVVEEFFPEERKE